MTDSSDSTFEGSGPDDPPPQADNKDDGGVDWGSWGALVGLYLAAIFFVSAVGIALSGAIGHLQGAIIASQVVGIAGAALIYSYVRGEHRAPWPDGHRLGLPPLHLGVTILGILALGIAANALMALEVHWFTFLEAFAEQYQQYVGRLILDATGLDRWLGIVAICLAAPICEELLFRGTFLPEQREFSSTTTAVIANGLLFAAFHQNPISLVPLAFIGAFLAHLVVLTESLWSAVFAHAMLNGFNGLVVPEVAPGAETTELAPTTISVGGATFTISGPLQLVGALVLFGTIGAVCWWWLARSVPDLSDRSPRTETS